MSKIDELLTEFCSGAVAGADPDLLLELRLAMQVACVTAWLVRADQVVLPGERSALEGVIAGQFGFEDGVGKKLSDFVLSLDETELPSREELLDSLGEQSALDRLQLVKALFSVASSDGQLHESEAAIVVRISQALKVPDAALHELLHREQVACSAGGIQFQLRKGVAVGIGRSADNTIQLPGLSVSKRHARLFWKESAWIAEDLGSVTGTWVDGHRIVRQRLAPGSVIQVENFCMRLDPDEERLSMWNANEFLILSADRLIVEVLNRRRRRRILDRVSFSAVSGELVALTGPSGCGKTTILHALLGSTPTTSGQVRLNGDECHGLLGRHSSRLGIVPQDDLLYSGLTVEESLFYSGVLRAVPDVSGAEIDSAVDRVIEELGLCKVRNSRIGDSVRRGISGGERKRVSLGQELLNPETRILILDEPTTGLDPFTGLEIFHLLRSLADQGCLVVVVTHSVNATTLALMDRILVVGATGKLAFFGPPSQMFTFFATQSVADIFKKLKRPSEVAKLSARFRASALYNRFVGFSRELLQGRQARKREVQGFAAGEHSKRPSIQKRSWFAARRWWRQYRYLTGRFACVKWRDTVAQIVNFGQIPLIVLGCWLVLGNALAAEDANSLGQTPAVTYQVIPGALPFILVISAFWVGCVSSVRELVAEQALFRRERMAGLRLLPYLFSKFTVLFAVSIVQAVLLGIASILLFGLHARHVSEGRLILILILTSFVGVACGLCASALFRTSQAAVAVLPALVVPQLLFGGLLVSFDRMPPEMAVVSNLMVSRWGVAGAVESGYSGWGAGKTVIPSKCTRFSLAKSSFCLGDFLELLGLARLREDRRAAVAIYSYGNCVAALSLQIVLFGLLATAALHRRCRSLPR